jgi:hypothetical protein
VKWKGGGGGVVGTDWERGRGRARVGIVGTGGIKVVGRNGCWFERALGIW